MHPKVARYVTYRQDLAINFIESIHVIPLCYARLVGCPSLIQLTTRIMPTRRNIFLRGRGTEKGTSRPCGRFFPTIPSLKPSAVKGVNNDRTTARVCWKFVSKAPRADERLHITRLGG